MILVSAVIGTLLVAIAMVLISAHLTKPERVALGLRTKWGLLGLEVVRPGWQPGATVASDVRAGPDADQPIRPRRQFATGE
jgi:hypothetical protein